MNANRWPTLVVILALGGVAVAQESTRDLRSTGAQNAFLTTNQLDRWLFDGEKGETIIVQVVSKEFDPVLELARTDEKGQEDKVLLSVDDPGNTSRYSYRLPEKGQYKIRVHAFKFQGGGNYTLDVRRFLARPLAVGEALVGTFDREGKGYHYFPAAKDQILVPKSSSAWTMLDVKGRALPDWAGTVLIDEGGEHNLVVSGPPNARYDLVVREARRRDLAEGKELDGALTSGEADVWSFAGKAGDFRLVEVEKKGELYARLIHAPLEKSTAKTIGLQRPDIAFVPVASRGGRIRFAAVLGQGGRYQLQLVAPSPASYKLTTRDPSVPIALGGEVKGTLPVGGAAFFSFKAEAGQLLQAALASEKFVPVLNLYDAEGKVVSSSDDAADSLEGRLAHLVLKEGLYRLHVASLGDGGGGDFKQSLTETKLKDLTIGGRGLGSVQPGATDFWTFAGKEGQTVFLNVRSSTFEPSVTLRSPDGVVLAADVSGNAATGSLVALRLPKTGRYTVGIASRRGAGDYSARLIDAD